MKKEEAIQLIEDISDEDILFHIKRAEKLKEKSGKKIGTYQGAEVWQTGDFRENYLILYSSGRVLYLVKSRLARLGRERFGQQVMAIKNRSIVDVATTGFLVWAFLKKLLPQYQILVSDEQQTRQGESAFALVIKYALQRKKFVYVFDRRTQYQRWARIEKFEQLRKNQSWIYGKAEGFRRVYLIMSEMPLAPKSPNVKLFDL